MEENQQEDHQLSEIADNLGKNLTLESPPNPSFPRCEQDFEHDDDDGGDDDGDDDCEGEENDGEFEFSFTGEGGLSSPVAAEELFRDGKIRPLFPFITADDHAPGSEEAATSYGPPVRKVFVVENDDVAEGPYCVWSSEKSPDEAPAPEMSKKSNSTGFSKLWRVKDLLVRSNSEGRDAFVFMNGKETTATAAVKKEKKVSLRKLKIGGETTAVAAGGEKGERKKRGKKPVATAATPATTAYEVLYGKKEKKKGGKSYLPYRQDLVGFFTNASGMTRNVHPY